MSKVFRLYNIKGNNNITDWQEAKVYGTQAISEITDPDGADASKEITSIPSPFARIDLIKTAFREVVSMANRPATDTEYHDFDENTIYHKMVSDTLDIAEIIFNIDRFKDFFEIIVWDRNKDLDEGNVFGKTLKRYLESDATGDDPYNFGKLERIYMLNYIGPDRPASMNIVGATSPATLFFSSANDLSFVSENISFGQDKPFDDSYQPLFKRNFEFQKYLYAFRKNYGEAKFHKDFPEIDDYLTSSAGKVCNYKFLTSQQKNEIDSLTPESIVQYEPILIGEKGEDTMEIFGYKCRKKAKKRNWQSDFEIKSDLYTGSKKPLVLPVEKGNTYANLKYTTDIWGKENKAPYFDGTPYPSRRLPIVSEEYPYLTISDFLADTIVRMPYEIDKNNFFDGNFDKPEGESYLLPLTQTFFHFFTTNDLTDKVMPDNKKMLEYQSRGIDMIKVILRIPIKHGYIEYGRLYSIGVDKNKVYSNEDNDGALFDKKFGLGIMPLVKFPKNVKKHYRIAMFDKGGMENVKLSYFNMQTDKRIKNEAHIERTPKDLDDNLCSVESYVINENFDRILVEIGDIKAFIVPKFKGSENESKGGSKFTFAIDFGTTNSHIEYCDNKTHTEPVSFNIQANEKQLLRLHKDYYDNLADVDDNDIKQAFEDNFIPDTIADFSQRDNAYFHSFPMRTVLSAKGKMDDAHVLYSLADGNIPFLYEKEAFPEYNDAITNLKWNPKIEKLISLYLGNIFILIRNKVLWNGGDLDKTKIIWFYPASMSPGKIGKLNGTWTELYKNYFGADTNHIICMSESSAPYHWFYKKEGGKSRLVTIDIGGGTTDVYVVVNKVPEMLMSFRFASNAVFGDGYNSNSDNNGFVKRYSNKFMGILNSLNYDNLTTTFSQIERGKNSSEIIAFLFSLADNKQVNGNKSLNFLEELKKDEQLRYVFILFYGSILYLIAQAMKKKGLKKPLTLAFSGNGAKTLKVLDDEKMKIVAKFAKLIFDGVFGEDSGTIEVIMRKNPKEATCKGGIISAEPQDYDSIKKIKYSPVGDDFDTAEEETIVKYSEISDDIKTSIVERVSNFVEFLFKLHKENDDFLTQYLDADESILQTVKELCLNKDDLSDFLERGIEEKQAEMDVDRKIEETLFFYPLVGVLNKLAREISDNNPNS